jgi:hypothetical protein
MTSTQPPRHPDDATLFDFAAGELDDATRADVRRHIERCSACSAFLAAATAGSDALQHAVTPLPEPAAHRLQLRVADAWDELHAGELDSIDAAPLRPARSTSSKRQRRPRARAWRRRAVPAMAFAVLAALAGVSFSLVDGGSTTSPKAQYDSRATAPATSSPQADGVAGAPSSADPMDAAPAASSPGGDAGAGAGAAAKETEQSASAGAAATSGEPARAPDSDIGLGDGTVPPDATQPQTATSDPERATAEAQANAATDSPATTDGTGAYEPVCVSGYDASVIALPNGRYPSTTISGPLGIVVVCG